MNRKHFLSALISTGAAFPGVRAAAAILPFDDMPAHPIIPPYLKEGDEIGITCPAGFINRDEIDAAVRIMESWGFVIRIGSTVGLKDGSFGGTDAQRAADFQDMLNNRDIKAIMCARGGYGSARMIDRLNFDAFTKHPKWIIGFSDITALHSHINSRFNISSIHSKMCNSFPDDFRTSDAVMQDTISSIYKSLTGTAMQYTAVADPNNRQGSATAPLVGGNLSVLQSMSGTPSEINTKGKILFLEEVGEYLYSLDRMLGTLERSGKLRHLKGLIIGGFNRIKPDDPGEEFGRTLYDMIFERVGKYNYPVCFNFPVGHQRNNYALKCNAIHTLQVSNTGTTLVEKTI
ncbi:muramoyltetrapeptide carboxypeptidase [Chitinophaga jiangningensis]|uniref:Muramoyltetrapeptide carboxypeptidase n=1 Tax=Chitinophaga jiangningensis TaxID=1419482 RepID=A0A1M6VX04_9BACT|nr:LD-carboxypeptidase [Chitinophaga jiangningensis]SHK85991.1 muramoyltetrapeptide carboxypeptidase [Chitinophaga jiangningensis]